MQWFIYSSALQDLCIGLFVLFLPVGYVMLMRLNKAETAVHGCQCLVGVWVCHLLQLFERRHLCCQMCFNPHKKKQDDLRGSWKLNDPLLTKGSKTYDPPPLCSGPPTPPPPIYFWPVPNYRSLISLKCPLIQVQPYSIAEKGKEDTEGHKIGELYEFLNDSTMIKCFERWTVERIEENSNDVSRLFIRYTHKYFHDKMRNKKLISRKKMTLHKDGSSALLNIALEKAGEKG